LEIPQLPYLTFVPKTSFIRLIFLQAGDEQPYLYRLTRLGILAQERNQGVKFAAEVSALFWSGTANWHEGNHLDQATGRPGLNLADMDEPMFVEAEHLESSIQDNRIAGVKDGHWGASTRENRFSGRISTGCVAAAGAAGLPGKN
jgi:hypothetical protein